MSIEHLSDGLLSDAQGPVLAYTRRERRGQPLADDTMVVAGRTVEEAAAAARDGLDGWRLTTADLDLASALMAVGSTLRRRALLMRCDLEPASPPSVAPFVARPLPDPSDLHAWPPILPAWRDAFPPSHPDHLGGDDDAAIAFFASLLAGSEMGPAHRSSCVLDDESGEPVAGIVVNVRQDGTSWDGPWISDIWRAPRLRGSGVGPLLIDRARAMLSEDGFSTLTLAVTHGNDAHRSYGRAGFRVVMDAWMLYVTRVPD